MDNSLWVRFMILISIHQLNELVKNNFVSVFYSKLAFFSDCGGKLLIILEIVP